MTGLTHAQRDLLLILQELVDTGGGVAPSYRELAAEMGDRINAGRVHKQIMALRDRGYVRVQRGRPRSLEILRRLPTPEEPEFVGTFEAPALVRDLVVLS